MNPFARPWFADLALLGVVIIWGFTFPMIKTATEHAPVFGFLTLRFALACMAFMPLLALRTRMGAGLRPCLFPGILAGASLFLGYAFQTFGLRGTSSTMGGFLTGTAVVLVPIGAALFLGHGVKRSEWIGVALVALGLPFLSGVGGEALHFGTGELLVLGCALAFAVQILVVGEHAPKLDPVWFTLVQCLVVLVASALLSCYFESGSFHLLFTPGVLSAVAFTGVLATTLAFWVQTEAQRHTSAVHVVLIFSLEPVFAAIAGAWLAGDELTRPQIAGAAAMFAGSLVAGIGPLIRVRTATSPSSASREC